MSATKPIGALLGRYTGDSIRGLAKLSKMPIYQLINIAIEKELEKEKPFEYDVTLPAKGDYTEYAFAGESNKIIEFLKVHVTGFDLVSLCLLRHDMNIPDKETFLAAFSECLEHDTIERFIPKPRSDRPERPKGYVQYRIKRTTTPKKKKNKASRYDRYMRLKKEFENEG